MMKDAFLWMMTRFKESCSWAGIGIVIHSYGQLWQNSIFIYEPAAWSALGAGLLAFVLPSRKY